MYNTWEELKSACENCHRCELCETRTNVVVGVGNENAEVMFIGEGPGENEDLKANRLSAEQANCLTKCLRLLTLTETRIFTLPIW